MNQQYTYQQIKAVYEYQQIKAIVENCEEVLAQDEPAYFQEREKITAYDEIASVILRRKGETEWQRK